MARVFVTRTPAGPGIGAVAPPPGTRSTCGRADAPDADAAPRARRRRDGLLALLTDRIDAELLAAAPKLRAIANFAVGYDNVELAAAHARGIPVGNTPEVLTDATADLTFALLLAAARKLPQAAADARVATG